MKGMTLIVVTVHFKDGIGMDGVNVDLIQQLLTISENGRHWILVAGDWNMQPTAFIETGMPRLLGCTVIHQPFIAGTCNTPRAKEDHVSDYIVVSDAIVPLLGDFKIVPGRLWWPHHAISFSLKLRPTYFRCFRTLKPKELPIITDAKGCPGAV